MRLLLLGTSGYHPTDSRQTACLMLPEVGVVLDAGTGMYRVARHMETDRLDIFLTHAHLDHVVGLTYLLELQARTPPPEIAVHGVAEKLAAVESHLFAPALFPVRPAFRFAPLDGEVPLDGGGRLSHFPLVHPGGAVGFRLDWPGRSMAYVTDTTAKPGADYLERIRGVELLVHECYFGDDQDELAERTGHSCLSRVVCLAAEANVGRLVLVHVDPMADQNHPLDLNAARRVFGETQVGKDGMQLEF